MTYTKISLYLANGIPEALSNLWYGSDSAVVEIRDAVEDAKNGKDLLNRIQKMVNIAYGKETCNPAARFLIAKGNAEVSSLTAGLWEIFSEDAYEKVMDILCGSVADYVEQNPDLRTQPTEDMWDFKDEEEDQDDSWDEEEDDWDEEEDYEDDEDY